MLKIAHITFLWMLLFFLFSQEISAQDTAVFKVDSIAQPKACETLDATDYVRKWLHIKKTKAEKSSSFFVAPILGSTPSTGFLFGFTLQSAFQLPESNMSAFQATVNYTTKKQLTLSLKNTVFA